MGEFIIGVETHGSASPAKGKAEGMTIRSVLQLCRKRRWALLFLSLTAGVFAAPYLYWTCILMRVVLRAAREEPVLSWLNMIDALGGLPLLMLAALGAGGCLSALRKMLRGEDGFIPREVWKGMGRCAKRSLPAGAVLGCSLGVLRVGLLNLHAFMPAGTLRTVASAFLLFQLAAAIWLMLKRPRRGSAIMLAVVFALDALILLLPPMRQGMRAGGTLDFLSRLYADSGGLLRGLLAASSVWPLLLAALLGSACCVMAAYACACYKFHARRLVFLAAVLLQILPMLASYSSLEQLLRNLELPITGTLLGFCWALGYLLVALLLYRRFARMLPSLQKNRGKFPGVRLFFYFALPRAPLHILALAALATLGCWDDALAPFWYMRRLGAFSLTGYVWEHLSGWGELALCLGVFLAMLGLFALLMRLRSRPPKPRSPRPSAD